MNAPEWIFFDLGSTLIDETLCLERRLRETLDGQTGPVQDGFLEEVQRSYAMNQDGYRLAARNFDLPKAPWCGECERLFPQTPQVLETLCRRYRLGVIANQGPEARARLSAWGIGGCFDVTVLSCEVGLSKPEPAIFRLALERADCAPERAWMVGDRLDNDILPAMALGMKTVWVRQGWGAWGNAALLPHEPTHIIDNIGQMLAIF
ncbi:MAG: HAD family hydrolase [Candidatus Enterenecus sp.]